MQKKEREQLGHLADLYSLNMRLSEPSKKGLTCPVLTKTRYVILYGWLKNKWYQKLT